MHSFVESLFAPSRHDAAKVQQINSLRVVFRNLSDDELRETGARADDLPTLFAVVAEVAYRMLGEQMFDVQLKGALALARGSIAEMQTGEGKTLAAVPAIVWHARSHQGVHVMTVNDYLAQRDAQWMREIYGHLGLSVGFVRQAMTAGERRAAYACDVTYATPNEIGFDFLRDQLALHVSEQVHRAFSIAVIDEADSILIDEARIPLVIAGGSTAEGAMAFVAERVVGNLIPCAHYTFDESGRNVGLTDLGVGAVEAALQCGNLYDERNLRLLSAVQDALHAHALLRRDVDYIVRNGVIEIVDEFKGRIAEDRRWPAGLHTAVEVKENVKPKEQGQILGSITLQHLVALYRQVCGMTGTAITQAGELKSIYGLTVEQIPTNRPVIRNDYPDVLFRTRQEKERAVLTEIRAAHCQGQPVLVGTASVAESERLSALLRDIPHEVLNAKDDAREAAIIAKAGERDAVTISTNMAGRGTDIRLGPGVAELGGLSVIGTNKHESSRIDNQLRGRAGRQGDPGCSRFFVSLEDDLMIRYGDLRPQYRHDPSVIQRLVEGQHLDMRIFLQKYEIPLEGQRNLIQTRRQAILDGTLACASELERLITLRVIDDLWADYLASVADYPAGVHWLSLGGRDPHHEYLRQIHQWFPEMEGSIPEEIEKRLAAAKAGLGADPNERGAVWTYVTTDQPFGTLTERIIKGLGRKIRKRAIWG